MQRYVKKTKHATLFQKKCLFPYKIAFPCSISCNIKRFSVLLHTKHTKQNGIMGLGSYWVRKDDQTDEAKTLKPWEEEVSNGDKFFPDPNGEGPSLEKPEQGQGQE